MDWPPLIQIVAAVLRLNCAAHGTSGFPSMSAHSVELVRNPQDPRQGRIRATSWMKWGSPPTRNRHHSGIRLERPARWDYNFE